MASELLKDMLRTADPAVLAALEAAAQADADGGDSSGADEHHALDLLAAGGSALSVLLMGRAAWKGGRKQLERIQKGKKPVVASGDSIQSGTASPVNKPDLGGGDSADSGQEGPPLKIVLDVARKSVARHYGIADPESLILADDEYDPTLSAWRFEFADLSGTTYNVALKSVGSKVAAVEYRRNRA
ncbi:hypothetical protein ACFCX7_07475 [Streptomyces microflavus]|uniref:hypothetical protein n=1 Tax=Streptomyces microflavus TaxID=1919 RepID=UPI0035D5F6A0